MKNHRTARLPTSETTDDRPPPYKWLLLDADNTFMDFSHASHASFDQLCKDYKLGKPADLYPIYQEHNLAAWKALEQKQLTTTQLKVQRMAHFLQAIERTAIDPAQLNLHYLKGLVQFSTLYEGAEEVLQELKYHYVLSIVTNGLKEVQRPRVHRLKLRQYFASIIVSDEIGIAKPDIRYFDYAYQTLSIPPAKSEILMVGDSLHSDIQGGINFGIDTCWISHNREHTTAISPNYTIPTFLDLPSLLL